MTDNIARLPELPVPAGDPASSLWVAGWLSEMSLRSTFVLLLAAALVLLLRRREARSRVLVLASLAPALLVLWVLMLPAWPGGSLQWRPVVAVPEVGFQVVEQLRTAWFGEPSSSETTPEFAVPFEPTVPSISTATTAPLAREAKPESELVDAAVMRVQKLCGPECADDATSGSVPVDGRPGVGWLIVLAVSICGAAFFLLRCLLGAWQLHRMRHGAEDPDAGIAETFGRVCASASLSSARVPRLLLTSRVDVPMTWGWLRPTILLPRVSSTWTRARLRIVLLHELGHVVHGDWRDRMALAFARSLFWWNPLVHWATRRLALEQELRCDEWVAGRMVPSRYAEELLSLHDDLQPHAGVARLPALAMLNRTQLERRMMHLLEPRSRRSDNDSPAAARSRMRLLLVLLVVAFLSIAAIRPRVVREEPTVMPVEQLQPEFGVVPPAAPIPAETVASRVFSGQSLAAVAPTLPAPSGEEVVTWPVAPQVAPAPLPALAARSVPAPFPAPSVRLAPSPARAPRAATLGMTAPTPAPTPYPVLAPRPAAAPSAFPKALSSSTAPLPSLGAANLGQTAPLVAFVQPSTQSMSPEDAEKYEELRARYEEIRAQMEALRARERERSAEVRAAAQNMRREQQERLVDRERELAMKQREIAEAMAERARRTAQQQASIERETTRQEAELEREVQRLRQLQAEALERHRRMGLDGEPSEAGSGQRAAEVLERLHTERAELLRRMEQVGSEQADRLRAEREAVYQVQKEALERQQALRRAAMELQQQQHESQQAQRELLERYESRALERRLETERLAQDAARVQQEMERVAAREALRRSSRSPRVPVAPRTPLYTDGNAALEDGLRKIIREEAVGLGLDAEDIEAGVRRAGRVLGTRRVSDDVGASIYVVGSPLQVREQLRRAWSDLLNEERGTDRGARLEDAINRLGSQILELELSER